jgi:hypothetical protein
MMSAARFARLAELEGVDPAHAYPLGEYLADLRQAVFGSPVAAEPDANRRGLQRVYIERLQAIVAPPPAPAGAGPGGGGQQPQNPLLAAPNLSRSDVMALARAQLREVQQLALATAGRAPAGTARAHWQDLADRARRVLEPER